jgi:hypothetical protein
MKPSSDPSLSTNYVKPATHQESRHCSERVPRINTLWKNMVSSKLTTKSLNTRNSQNNPRAWRVLSNNRMLYPTLSEQVERVIWPRLRSSFEL